MMDEKRLYEMLEAMGDYRDPPWNEIEEVFRLARLGLWAEKHGIPALKSWVWVEDDTQPHWGTDNYFDEYMESFTKAKEALAALPKDEKNG